MSIKKIFQVCVITGSRAEYGLLKLLLFRLRDNSDVDLKLVVTGTHLSKDFGNTQKEIQDDGFKSYIKIPIIIDNDSKEGMALSVGNAITEFAKLFTYYKPDIIIVLGDRFEIFAASIAAHLISIPVAHISGGDITEGAVDDAIRHCLTKLSYLHFTGCEESAKRVIQMGEEPNRVFNVGELGVENCIKMKLMSKMQLENDLNFNGINENYAVVTFHPVTMENNTVVEQIYELIKAMDAFKNISYIITMANADAGGRRINNIWIEEGRKRKKWLVVPSLGVLRYLSAIKYARLVIGNSSSGIIEAPSMGTPTINIGDRQKGRMMANSVICCRPIKEEIINAINYVLTDEFQKNMSEIKSPFGDGNTSEQIVREIIKYLNNKGQTIEKKFYNIEFLLGDT